MLKLRFIIIGLAVLLAGCKSSEPEISYTPPPIEDDWSVIMVQSGGIMGLKHSIQVSSDGKYSVVDERAGRSVDGELGADELAALRSLVADFSFTAPKMPAVCADCFVYNVTIQSGGQKMIAEIDDVNMPETGMAPLVEFLRGIMDAALK